MYAKEPFEEIVRKHGAQVLRVCRGVLGLHTDADDAWSETFIAGLRAWPSLPDDANVAAWLVTIAHRKAIDITRARKRRALPADGVPDQESNIGIPGSTDHDLWDAVRELPNKQRQAVVYHYLGGLSYKEVALILGGSEAAARRAASDGIQALRVTYLSERVKCERTS
ncbi:MAG: sigma-70 family RNA polymerase sigma factor [Dehalococcoidia bacterium]|nr:sigma-70 family RNA polymerase sigma factor [Dehalococcoidia bacterium]